MVWVFYFGLSLPLLYWGEKVVNSGLAAVLYASCPVTTIVGAKLMRLEGSNARGALAATFAFVGVAIIFWRQVLDGGSALGFASVLLAATSAAVSALMLQRGPRQNAIAVNAVGAPIGLVCRFLASLALRERMSLPTTARAIFPIVYLAVASSVGAFVLFAWLIGQWRATTASFLGIVIPLIAVVLGAIVRHEAFAPGAAFGAIIVIASVIVALASERSPAAALQPQEPGAEAS